MSIKFLSLFQDTWNFVRNRPQFVLYAVICWMVLQIAISQAFPKVQLDLQAVQNSPEIAQQAMLGSLIPAVLSLFAVTLVNVLLILNIKAINQGQYRHFFQYLAQSVQRFIGVAILSFIQLLPLSIGVSFILIQGSGASLIALPLMITGLFVYIKLNLVIYAYLLEEPQQSIGQTLRLTWTMSRGNMMPLIMFCALTYFIPLVLSGVVSGVEIALGDTIGATVSQFVSAFVNLLITIFSFRFYQVYRQTVKGNV